MSSPLSKALLWGKEYSQVILACFGAFAAVSYVTSSIVRRIDNVKLEEAARELADVQVRVEQQDQLLQLGVMQERMNHRKAVMPGSRLSKHDDHRWSPVGKPDAE